MPEHFCGGMLLSLETVRNESLQANLAVDEVVNVSLYSHRQHAQMIPLARVLREIRIKSSMTIKMLMSKMSVFDTTSSLQATAY